jgi:hypothetical protein
MHPTCIAHDWVEISFTPGGARHSPDAMQQRRSRVNLGSWQHLLSCLVHAVEEPIPSKHVVSRSRSCKLIKLLFLLQPRKPISVDPVTARDLHGKPVVSRAPHLGDLGYDGPCKFGWVAPEFGFQRN